MRSSDKSERDSATDGRQYHVSGSDSKFTSIKLGRGAMLVKEPFEFCFWEPGTNASDSSSVQVRCKKWTVRVHDINKHRDIDVLPLSDPLVESANYATPAGVPQGSPLSPSLYLYYNSDLLELPPIGINHMALGFIDDTAYGVRDTTVEGNSIQIEELLSQAEEWRSKHGAKFEKTKYVLIHFTRNSNTNTEAAVSIDSTLVIPSKEGKYLGVIFDQDLKFRTHTDQAVKALDSASQ
jgi:Reverse transcriptase (RNA-dependent DNA polymerase)